MSQHIEIEFKNLLTEEEFHNLKNYFHLHSEDFFSQENDYFDTLDFSLKKLGCAMRIRRKADTIEWTLKEPHPEGLLETNVPITKAEAEDIIKNQKYPPGQIINRLRELNIDIHSIAHFGTLKTWRAELPYKEGLLVFDYSSYLNTFDYEIEYEVKDAAIGKDYFFSLLKTFQIPVRKTDNKIERFYKKLKFELNE